MTVALPSFSDLSGKLTGSLTNHSLVVLLSLGVMSARPTMALRTGFGPGIICVAVAC